MLNGFGFVNVGLINEKVRIWSSFNVESTLIEELSEKSLYRFYN